ncbi:Endosomal protein P24B [Intoshia linei]|uniref:Endosomal protein P24B n=1 Tax=Intoshia linei TaxID=1819745 RepID=A0A177B202_9BILA|nr:Endosomal protein P24B [Intoshia linei]
MEILPHTEDCYFDTIEKINTRMTLTFEVIEGGFLDIDVKITGSDGAVIYEGLRETNGKYTYSASSPGDYKYCFGNRMSTMTPKVIIFKNEITEPTQDDNSDRADRVNTMLDVLHEKLISIKRDQEYLGAREKVHHRLNDNTNHRVSIWAIFEALLLISMTIGQIYYLKKFFEVRRVV